MLPAQWDCTSVRAQWCLPMIPWYPLFHVVTSHHGVSQSVYFRAVVHCACKLCLRKFKPLLISWPTQNRQPHVACQVRSGFMEPWLVPVSDPMLCLAADITTHTPNQINKTLMRRPFGRIVQVVFLQIVILNGRAELLSNVRYIVTEATGVSLHAAKDCLR